MDQRLWRPAGKAPAKQKKPDRYIKLPLWFASAAAKATNTRKAMVWIWLVWLAFENRSLEFPVPNGRLRQWGVSRYTKDKAVCRQSMSDSWLGNLRECLAHLV